MDGIKNPIKLEFGYVKLFNTRRIEGDTLYFGGYSIKYDQNGLEVSRTPNTEYCSLNFSNQSNESRKNLGLPLKPSLFERFKTWMG